MTLVADTLPDDPGTLKAMLIAERLRAERLEQIIKELQRHRFGRRAETLPEDQLLLGLEDVEQGVAADEASQENDAPAAKAERIARRRANRGSLPAHLPRIETLVDIEDKTCPCCRHGLHVIGEDVAERPRNETGSRIGRGICTSGQVQRGILTEHVLGVVRNVLGPAQQLRGQVAER